MEKLAVFKVIDFVPNGGGLECCGFFNCKEDAIAYLMEVKKIIDTNFQNNYAGEYIIIPTLYFNITKAGEK